ncbi:hypothetical protein Q4566_14955 [Tamlana sp. 2_MG-2023]|uniref:hypothetical protein n=1 Tax=unclassified Tamlana TaxID=2614803 RepID=UPI0026E2E181|nr:MULTISPECIES: hypothetical protein [unclassified Tamlana]MDO6761509.1 hypothetical protein [Tamlana sp. 2_MG-2023]MDO6792397.1 hypothetical protein [Tamlana sp. 1_MG-2023]
MKKLVLVVLGFILGAAITYYFCPRPLEESVEETKIVKPNGLITIDEAKDLNNNWTKFRKGAVDSASAKQGRKKDTRSTSWDLEEVENYIAYAKNQADSLGYDMTGLRVYLGVYGKNQGQAKKNLSTMFMVPTGKKNQAKASTIGLSLQNGGGTIPIEALNKSSGGSDGFPD